MPGSGFFAVAFGDGDKKPETRHINHQNPGPSVHQVRDPKPYQVRDHKPSPVNFLIMRYVA